MRKRTWFTPTTVTGCSLWLDSSDSATLTTSGSAVLQWNDKSGNGNNATPSGSGPTNANPGVTFNGTNQTLALSYNGSPTTESLFVVIKFNSVASEGDIFTGTATGQREYLLYGGNMYLGRYATAPSGSANGGSPITGTTYLMEYVYTASAISFFQAGNPYYSGTPQFTYSAGGTVAYIGSYGSGGYLSGIIYELVVYNTAVSDYNRSQIEGYLAQKWNLKSSLPANHPGLKGIIVASQAIPQAISLIYPVSFVPTQISGCVLWLDGTDPLGTGTPPSNGASISTWYDKSSSGNNATGGTSPTFNSSGINSKGVVSFNGANTYLNSTDLFSNRSFSIFIIIRRQGNIGGQTGILAGTQFGTNLNLHFVFRSNTDLALGFYSNDLDYVSFTNYTGNTSTEPAYLIQATYTSGSRILYVNGNQVASDTNGTNLTSDTGALIGQYNGTYYNGFIGEICILNGTPDTTSRKQVEGYLAWKWGLQSSLPADHTYKSSSPSITNALGISRPANLPICSIACYPTAKIITSGLINRWLFNEGSGTTFIDSVGGQNGTWTGSPAYVTVGGRRAIYLANTTVGNNSATQYGTTTGGQPASVYATTNWSFTIWIYPLTYLIEAADVFFGVGNYFDMYVASASGQLAIYSNSMGTAVLSSAGTGVSLNVWSQVTFTCSNGTVTSYINGTSIATGTYTARTLAPSSITYIGAYQSTAFGVNMYLSDARVYNRALTQAEISQIYSINA